MSSQLVVHLIQTNEELWMHKNIENKIFNFTAPRTHLEIIRSSIMAGDFLPSKTKDGRKIEAVKKSDIPRL